MLRSYMVRDCITFLRRLYHGWGMVSQLLVEIEDARVCLLVSHVLTAFFVSWKTFVSHVMGLPVRLMSYAYMHGRDVICDVIPWRISSSCVWVIEVVCALAHASA